MGKTVYMIVDHLDLIKEWDKGAMILQFLFSLYSVLKLPQLGVILISGLPPDVYYSNMGYTDPLPVYFPDVVLRPFCRVTRRVEELSTTFSLLFRKYCEPLDDLGVSPNEDLKRRLYSNLKPHIASCLNEIFRVSSHPHDGERRQEASNSSEKGGELEMPQMFNSTGGMDNRERKWKASEKSMEKKEIAEQEAAMKGPGSFPLERILAIFQCIASVGDSSFNEEEEQGGGEEATGYDRENNKNMMMSDILLQVPSLYDANFIIKSGSFPLEGSVRYRSMVSEDLSLKVTHTLFATIDG
ncbi:hypothetical protein F2Q70_00041034 [Brassica cretica]|uniref:Uncharacterized protein n=1 Tax=Brassica cretica TaxID=69181 RepID=A0A8S9K297_BRACR|nr:hypothetical protein F2Q70_00041034 [Brassica cretica]